MVLKAVQQWSASEVRHENRKASDCRAQAVLAVHAPQRGVLDVCQHVHDLNCQHYAGRNRTITLPPAGLGNAAGVKLKSTKMSHCEAWPEMRKLVSM